MSKEITSHNSRRVNSDKHFILITVNQTTQIFERSTLYNWLYNCITSAKSPKMIYTTTHSLPNYRLQKSNETDRQSVASWRNPASTPSVSRWDSWTSS